MQNADLLVRAEFLYPVTGGVPVIPDGEVAIVANRIVYAGPRKPDGHWHAARTIAGAGRAVLPGFVNAHCHTASIVFRSQTDDHAAKAALLNVAFRMEKDISDAQWQLLGTVGCADMLRAGITTINDIWYNPQALARTVAECGLRAQIANKVFDVRLEALCRDDYTRYRDTGQARLRHGVEFVEQWEGAANGRITTRIGTHAPDTCDAGLWREARAEATRLGVGMHTHAAQSVGEVDHILTKHGCGPMEYLRDNGVLAPDIVLAHLTLATDGDLAAVRETGAAYAHCPTIYPRRGRYPRLEEILSLGIPTGFGTDWMLNDPFEGMRMAIQAMRLRLGDPGAMTCEQALRLHTIDAARVIGLSDQIGSLEAGKKADLITVNLERPHLQPYYGAPQSLVFYAKSSDVDTSIIDGRIVLEGGQPTRLDLQRAMANLGTHVAAWRGRLSELGSTAVAGPGCPCCG